MSTLSSKRLNLLARSSQRHLRVSSVSTPNGPDRSAIVTVAGILSVVVAGAAGAAIGLFGISAFLGILLTGLAVFNIYFGTSGKLTAIASTTVVCGLVQGPFAALTQSGLALWLDDVCLAGMAAGVLVRLMKTANEKRIVLALVVLGFVCLAVLNAHAPAAAIYQARQIAVPVLLLFFGSVLTSREMKTLANVLFAVASLSFVYMLLEVMGVRLIDPWAAYGFNQFSTSVNAVAAGRELPGNYYYYYGDSGSDVFIRAGGLHFNPPGLAIFMGSVALYAKLYAGRNIRVMMYFVAGLSSVLSVGRAGAVVYLLAMFQNRVSKILSRVGFLIVAVAGAVILNDFFGSQGKSGSHSEGLAYGFIYGLTHPLGGGFGVVGNASESSIEGVGESLLGLVFASIGWFAIAIVGWLLYRALCVGFTIPGVALTAVLVTSALSESTSGLAVAAPLWILAGSALSVYKSGDNQTCRNTR